MQQVHFPKAGETILYRGSKYVIGNPLGAGAFGKAYECRDGLDYPLVAKVLKPRGPQGPTKSEICDEWMKEFNILSSLRHDNIITIYDAFEYGNLYYLILERAHGSLSDLIRQHGAIGGPMVISIGQQLLSALHYIHSRNIIHRDFHIDNLLYFHSGAHIIAKVTDFGISKILNDGEEAAFGVTGRGYDVAPELVRYKYTTYQSDLYQLGLVLYNLHIGTPALGPADGQRDFAVESGVARRRAEDLGTPLGNCIASLLRRSTDWRFSTAAEAWHALQNCLPSLPR